MSDNMKIATVFPAVGLFLMIIAVLILVHTFLFLLSAKRVKGTVVRLAYYCHSDGSRYDPVFQFTTLDGHTLVVEDNVGSNPPQFRVGQSVNVLYDPKNPRHARIHKGTNLFFAPLLLICMGVCFMGIGSLFQRFI